MTDMTASTKVNVSTGARTATGEGALRGATASPRARRRTARPTILASVLSAGLVGAVGATALQGFVAPSFAEAVRVEAPAIPSFADVVERVSPAVVSVRVRSTMRPASMRGDVPEGFDQLPENHPFRRFFERGMPGATPEGDRRRFGQRRDRRGREGRPGRERGIGQGSGFFISEDGFLVTNNHVVENGTAYTVVMDDGTELDATLVGADPRTDLAVLKVEEEREFTYVSFADDASIRVGDWTIAVGSPFGLGSTVTVGVISARGRNIGAGPYDDFLQVDAAVNRGNSGGPSFNLSGEVVGVNTAIFSPSGGSVGIGFAVPASLAQEVVEDLIDDGMVQRGYLGVRIQPVTDDIAESLGLESARGALVSQAEEGTPAAEAGIRAGDVIAEVNGQSVRGPRVLSRRIASIDPDEEVELTIFRDGESLTRTVTLGELEGTGRAGSPRDAEPSAFDGLGIEVAPNDDGEGVRVVAVDPDGPAFGKGIREGDVVVSVGGASVRSAAELDDELEAIAATGKRSALVRVEGERGPRFVALPVEAS